MRIGHDHAQFHLPRGFVDGGIGKHQKAFLRVNRAVFKLDVHFDAAVNGFQTAVCNLLAQLHDFGSRLGYIGIHRIGLLDIGHRRRTVRTDQRAFGNIRLADKAGNRRGDAGIVHIDLCRLDGRPGCFHTSFGRTFSGNGGIIFLLADGIGFYQRAVARQVGIGFGQRRFGRSQLGARAFQRGDISRVFQLIQRLAFAHIAALFKQAAFDDTAYLRAHVGGTHGLQTAGQFDAQGHILRLYGNHFDHGRGSLLLLRAALFLPRSRLTAVFAAAGGQSQSGGGSQNSQPCRVRGKFLHHIVSYINSVQTCTKSGRLNVQTA